MSTQESDQAIGLDGLVLEQLDQEIGTGVNRREKTVWGGLWVILAPDVGLGARTKGADDGGHVGAHLHQVGCRDPIALILVKPGLGKRHDLLEATVSWPADLLRVQDEGAIGTTVRPSALGPSSGVVEAKADGSPCCIGTSARWSLEGGHHLVGDVLPHTTGVSLALRCAQPGDVGVCLQALAVGLAEDRSLDIFADRCELAVLQRLEVADGLVGVQCWVRGTALPRHDIGLDLIYDLGHAWMGYGVANEGCACAGRGDD